MTGPMGTSGDDDVEMEFISVMGVLVPMEVTKGVSEEALRFATGSISSEAETCSNGCQEEQILNSNILDNMDNAKGKMEGDVDESDTKKEMPNRNESEERLHPSPVKPKSSKKRESKKTSSPADSSGVDTMHKAVREKVNMAKVTKTKMVERKSKKKIHKSNDKLDNLRKQKKKRSKTLTGTSQVSSQNVQSSSCKEDIENTKPIGHSIVSPTVHPANEEVSTGKKITKTWVLESDNEEQGKKQQKKKSSSLHSSTTGPKASSVAIKVNSRSSSDDNGVCTYPDCTQPLRYRHRCAEHNNRRRCSVLECTKFAHSGGNCIAHGGGSRCMEYGCVRRSRSQGKCYAHGGGIRCSHPSCNTRAKSKGKCVAHGGGTVCSERGCFKLAISNGKCISHGGYIHCSLPECDKRAQVRGKCVEHSEEDITSKTGNCEQPMGSKKELDEMTMKLRSGQRVKLAPRWRNNQEALQSEEKTLEMALKLSVIEY